MWIQGGQPEKEWFVLRTCAENFQPVLATARVLLGGHLFQEGGFCGGDTGRQLEAAGVCFGHQIKVAFRGIAEMPFAGGSGPVTGLAQPADPGVHVARQGPVKLFGPGRVRITPGDHAGPARTAGAGRNEGVVEADAFSGEAIDVGGIQRRMTVGTAIIPSHVVRDDDDEIGARFPQVKADGGAGQKSRQSVDEDAQKKK